MLGYFQLPLRGTNAWPGSLQVAERRTLTSLIEEGLRLVVSDARKKSKSKRILPRHSDASGPPLPGIDISNSAALQEIDDLEYTERLKSGFE